MIELKELLKMSQDEIRAEAMKLPGAVELKQGNVFVAGTMPYVLVAHMDTVYNTEPTQIADDGNKLYTHRGSSAGIGGDDRCGCYLLFKAAEWANKPALLFCADEEKGGRGSAGLATGYRWSAYKCFIEIDGPGYGNFYAGETSNTHLNDFLSDEIGLTQLATSFNDIAHLCKPGNPPGVTLGAAYYSQHNANAEWISLLGLNVQEAVLKLINQRISLLPWSIVPESKRPYSGSSYTGSYGRNTYTGSSYNPNAYTGGYESYSSWQQSYSQKSQTPTHKKKKKRKKNKPAVAPGQIAAFDTANMSLAEENRGKDSKLWAEPCMNCALHCSSPCEKFDKWLNEDRSEEELAGAYPDIDPDDILNWDDLKCPDGVTTCEDCPLLTECSFEVTD